MLPAASGHAWSELSRFVERREIDGIQLPLLGLEGLLLTKERQREKDRADARVLRAALERLRGGLDR